jgi:alpha-galactosidase
MPEKTSSDEREMINEWIRATTEGTPPFSFLYDQLPSAELLSQWPRKTEAFNQADGTIIHRIIYTDDKTGLECVLELVEYPENPLVEWVIHFKNTSGENTPVLSNIKALDIAWSNSSEAQPILYYSKGTAGTAEAIDDFALQSSLITPGLELELASNGSSQFLPFFNLETGNKGVICAVGWTGNWIFSIRNEGDSNLSIRAGMAHTHLVLYPGEEIRTPRMLLLFWKDDILHGHNMLKRHIVLHHMPRLNGQEVEAPICICTWGAMKAEKHLKLIRFIKDNNLKYDCYWIDAGWFGSDHETDEFQNLYVEDWVDHLGHFRVNRAVYPDGLRPISDAAHDAGMKFMLWFPTFVGVEDAPWVQEHPEWTTGGPISWGQDGIGLNKRVVNIYQMQISSPDTQKWLLDTITDLLTEHGVDYYREDGGSPGASPDEPERQGIGEIRAVEGLYAFWDELRRRCPGLLIDNCCGGGKRIDLETIGRSLVLNRTDYNIHPDADPIGSQVGTFGLAHWVPLVLVGGAPHTIPGDTYRFRSSWSGGMWFNLFRFIGYGEGETEPVANYPVQWHQEMIAQYRRARAYYKGDFYPLTECTLSRQDWFAYQMDRPDLGEGLILAFRRQESPFITAEMPLKGLDIEAIYDLENADSGETVTVSGKSLIEKGISISITTKPGSWLLFYKKRSSPYLT